MIFGVNGNQLAPVKKHENKKVDRDGGDSMCKATHFYIQNFDSSYPDEQVVRIKNP